MGQVWDRSALLRPHVLASSPGRFEASVSCECEAGGTVGKLESQAADGACAACIAKSWDAAAASVARTSGSLTSRCSWAPALDSLGFWRSPATSPKTRLSSQTPLQGMAVLPGGHFVATACPREIRGWAASLVLRSCM